MFSIKSLNLFNFFLLHPELLLETPKSWQDFHLETDVLNHIEKIQSNLQPGGQDAYLPHRIHQVEH